MLQIAFGRDRIAGRLRIARQLQIFLGDMMRGAADLDVGSIRLVGPRQRIGALAIVADCCCGRAYACSDLVSSIVLE